MTKRPHRPYDMDEDDRDEYEARVVAWMECNDIKPTLAIDTKVLYPDVGCKREGIIIGICDDYAGNYLVQQPHVPWPMSVPFEDVTVVK